MKNRSTQDPKIFIAYANAASDNGFEPLTQNDCAELAASALHYFSGEQPAGIKPLALVPMLIGSMSAYLQALSQDSSAAVLDAQNGLMKLLLDVSDITAAFMKSKST